MKFAPLRKFRISALVFGIIAATVAVCVQVFGSFSPPQAYGVCMVCHARDLVNSLFNQFPWYSAAVSTVALKGLILTTVGIFLGAIIMSVLSGEFKLHFVENPLVSFLCGFIVMTAGLVISGCPMRLLLRTAYGDLGAGASIITLVLGIFLGTMILKRRATKRAAR